MMASFVVKELISLMKKKDIRIKKSKILVLGITFKENCPDTRNSMVKNIIKRLNEHNVKVDVMDPYVSSHKNKGEKSFNYIKTLKYNTYDSILIAVAHDEFKRINPSKLLSACKKKYVIYDLKKILPSTIVDKTL